MNTKMKMRMLSLLLCFVMLVGLMPTTAFAWTAPTLSGGNAAWNVQLSDEGVLTWNDMSSATYDIQVDETAMGGTVTKIQGISGTSYNLINRFKELKIENGTYYFYIKANDTDATSGDISFKYVSPEPKLSAPQNLRWDGTVAKWDSVANATGYAVMLYSDSGSLQLSKTTTETQYDWDTNVYNDGFWFEVVATGDNYRNSNAAEGPKYGTYSWTAPTLTGGKAAWNVTLSDDGMLRWNNMSSATYDIYVDETEMGGTVTNIYNINTNAFNLINRLKDIKAENGIYYFSIKANDTEETSGDISFRYVSPETKLAAPQNLRWEGTVAKWDSVDGASEYKVILYTDSGSVQLNRTATTTQYDWESQATDGRWFEVVATADGYRDSNAAESPKYIVVNYSIGAYPYDATVSQTQAGGQVYLTTDEGSDGWSSDGYIKKATEGTTVTLNANPAAGYKFVEWRQGTAGATISTEANYQFAASEDKYLYAVFETISSTTYDIELAIFDITYTAIDGGTVSIQANKGFSDSGSGVIGQATENTAVTITAVPKAGYEFVAWKLWTPHNATAFSTNATYTFNATEELFIYAVFQETQQQIPTYEINCVAHNLSANETGGTVQLETDKGGTGYATSQQKHATENTTVKVRARAEEDYEFVEWRKGSPTDANAVVSTEAYYEFTATEAVWIYAVFQHTPTCTIDCSVFDITNGINNGQNGVGGTVSIQTDKGSVEGATPMPIQATRNSSVTVNAVAAQGYEFIGWKKSSPYVQENLSTSPTYTFTINEYLYLYAVFQETANVPTYTISFAANGGTGTMADVTGISGEYTLPANAFTAPDGKQFKAWSVGGAEKAVGDKITVTANTTVSAIWEAVEYNVTVTGGTASVGAGTPITKATMGTTVTLIAGQAPSGQMFDKWVVNGVVVADANSATTTFVMPAGNVTAEATYKDIPVVTYTVTFDANGGSGSMPVATGVSGDYILPVCGFTAPAGQQFKAWNVGGNEKDAGATINVTANTTVTAIWENIPVVTYTVSFAANGGTGTMADVTGISGEYTLPANGFTAPDGKQFKAWMVGGSEKAAGDKITVTADTTVTAVWENIPVTYYTVTFDSDGGSAVTAQSIEAGQKATKPVDPTKDGFDFKGWTLNGSAYDFNTAVDSNIILVATWEQQQVVPTTYTVSFAANGGTGTMADVTGISGEYTLPANGFTAPDGKQFKAWSVGGAEKAVGDKITVTADTTVTAVWEDIPVTTYTITFNANGGSVTPASAQTNAEGKLISLPTPTRSGSYSFKGWYTAASGGTKVTTSTVFNANTTIYAQWTYTGGGGGIYYPTFYTVTVNKAEGGSVIASSKSAIANSTITLTVTPDEGYEFDAVKVVNKSGKEITISAAGDKFIFKMPSSNVTVTAIFKKIEAPVAPVTPATCPKDNTCPMYGYTDLVRDNWYHDGVHFCIEEEMMLGTSATTFEPDTITSRAMVVTILWRLEGKPIQETSADFFDVPNGQWYTDAVHWASANGIVLGYGDSTFGPNDTITREQMATIMWRYAKYKGYDVSVGENTNILSYADVEQVSEWAIPAMQWACGSGLINGTGNDILDPNGNATRAQAATILYRFCDKIKEN